MDLIKTGNFIAKSRKEKGLTQKELADKLHLSEKTISKRERGRGFPDVNLILPLCKTLEIDVNELLTGEKLDNDAYRKKADENLVNLMDKTNPKVKYVLSVISIFFTIIFLIFVVLLVTYVIEDLWVQITLLIGSFIIMILNILVGVIISLNFEVYECVHCKEKFVPSFKEYIFGPHTLTKRYLKCPYCHKKGWDKFCIRKNKK